LTLVAAALAVLTFMAALERFGVAREASEAAASSRTAAGVITDRSLSDEAKERAFRSASVALFRRFLSIGIRSVGALAVSLIPILVLTVAGLTTAEEVTSWLATARGLISTSVVAALWVAAKWFL
jgi:hypothetical protein